MQERWKREAGDGREREGGGGGGGAGAGGVWMCQEPEDG